MKATPDPSSALDRLREHLSAIEPGPVPEAERPALAAILTDAWRDLAGDGHRAFPGWRRAHEVMWTPPVLTWDTWRPAHYYEHLERWTVDLERKRCRFTRPERREMAEPAIQRPVDTAAIADELTPLIVERRRDDERLQWTKAGNVRVPANRVFPPATGWTTNGRRRRLHRDLEKRLAPRGWHPRPWGWWEYTGKTQDPPPWYDELQVCGSCGDLFGKITHRTERVSAWQDCRCTRSVVSQMWALHGLMFAGHLCYCCGQVPLASESKFSVWFCEGCIWRARALNARLGRYVVPVGGHSIHGGFLLRGDASPVDFEIFADRWIHVTDVMTGLVEWSGEVVRRVIVERLPEGTTRIPIASYLAVCRDAESEKTKCFGDMMGHLEQQG